EIYRVVSKGRTSRSNGARVLSLNIDNPETPDDPPFKVRVREEFFAANDQAAKDIPWKELNDIQQFNFGLAITAHKAQGSQWGNVCVFDESRAFGANRRQWLYTAVTRAANHLTLVMQ
ncbi:ATP-binding protein, partial [Salmonella enterica subsp. enterica serovar Java]|nr:ATP-binding protein [Salmonella enterica subsp. enterica serovar Java]